MMWRKRCDGSQIRDQLFKDLIDFILRANTSDDLLRDPTGSRLENLTPSDRAEIVDRVRNGCTPLFLAAKRGLVNIAIYLVDKCNANIEKKGVYEVQLDHTIHYVTPLWCAAVVGQLAVCEALVQRGADVNTVSDTGSTAIRSACYMSNKPVVEYLVAQGADVNRANNNGGTCLINSVQALDLCRFLIEKGANVNARDSQFKTALHYAVQELRFETVKLLLKHGADHKAQSKHGDDALQAACLKGCEEIANYLMDNLDYSPERIADAYELLGATFAVENHDIGKAIDYWKRAILYRQEKGIGKDIDYPTHSVYMGVKPFRTIEEVDELAVNLDKIRIHSLMINERVLGKSHKDTIYRLMYRGAAFADRLMYERCIDLWKYVIDIRLLKDSVLHHDTCVAFETLVIILFDRYDDMSEKANADWSASLNDALFLLEKCIDSFPKAIEQLKTIPTFRRHEENWDRLLQSLVHLLHLAVIVKKTPDEASKLRVCLKRLNWIAPRTVKGNSLLHLAAGRVDGINRRNPQVFGGRQIFPDPVTTSALLETGAAVEATNQDGSTALHVASLRINYRQDVVELLLGKGAHIDRTNRQGNTPYRMLNGNQECKINVTNLITLKCLAATKVKSLKIRYEKQVPNSLIPFVRMH
ncbi:protein fem-1 homolog A [Galendromus occidentalis]|uniref:Protein fem-1 homolog A n=1 Tax=Galendromus occidentalis TaxID=34638 RepID=A0AAJ6W057_9ACAR|nr:protein fem-1 homolog A [Galendromus occidentalis]